MNSRKYILSQTGLLALGQLVCIGAMIGVFALAGHFDYRVILGAVVGGILAIGNFFFMAIGSDTAADRATENQDVKFGKTLIRFSYTLRLLVIGVLVFVLAKTGHCNVLAMVCPLLFTFPIIIVIEFFRKMGGKKS
jgi:hypothetical protein